MLPKSFAIGGALAAAALLLNGCLESVSETAPIEDAATSVLGEVVVNEDVAGETASPDEPAASTPAVEPTPDLVELPPDIFLRGTLAPNGSVVQFDLGAFAAGEVLTLENREQIPVLLALFDANENLLTREYLGPATRYQHSLRAAHAGLRAAITFPGVAASTGLPFFVLLQRRPNAVEPAQRQVVWLNFDGVESVAVHTRPPETLAPFEAANLGPAYVGQTGLMKAAIVQAMRDDFAAYDVELLVSGETPQPASGAVLHFGGFDPSLLGIADDVDEYNRVTDDTAIVFTDAFSIYQTMLLTPEEMAVMIANVGSHELGHLLGLYHSRDPQDVMDTTGTAWDLAGPQAFARAPLEAAVFPTGWQDADALLKVGVGAAEKTLDAKVVARRSARSWIRRIVAREFEHACGTCAQLPGRVR